MRGEDKPDELRRSPTVPNTDHNTDHKTGRDFHKLYTLNGIIGRGGFGIVYAGLRKKDKLKVAVKELPKAKVFR